MFVCFLVQWCEVSEDPVRDMVAYLKSHCPFTADDVICSQIPTGDEHHKKLIKNFYRARQQQLHCRVARKKKAAAISKSQEPDDNGR